MLDLCQNMPNLRNNTFLCAVDPGLCRGRTNSRRIWRTTVDQAVGEAWYGKPLPTEYLPHNAPLDLESIEHASEFQIPTIARRKFYSIKTNYRPDNSAVVRPPSPPQAPVVPPGTQHATRSPRLVSRESRTSAGSTHLSPAKSTSSLSSKSSKPSIHSSASSSRSHDHSRQSGKSSSSRDVSNGPGHTKRDDSPSTRNKTNQPPPVDPKNGRESRVSTRSGKSTSSRSAPSPEPVVPAVPQTTLVQRNAARQSTRASTASQGSVESRHTATNNSNGPSRKHVPYLNRFEDILNTTEPQLPSTDARTQSMISQKKNMPPPTFRSAEANGNRHSKQAPNLNSREDIDSDQQSIESARSSIFK